ncbi:MAG: M23 family metallopeptidase [Flavobacteriales bacterium]|nr:M23 family metallopeptidase [Flavobacteriales bacterium]
MSFKNIFFYIIFSVLCTSILAQDYHPPLDFKLLLSGTFGELRSNHFHSGIDIKTEGVQGQKVYSIADGYVSRIKVSTWGYGKALYITHPDGNTSVYAHLKDFNKAINDYVIENQHKKESYEIQLYPPKDKFQIKKGEVIALSGNTGGSAGAHLHFEIRNTKTEHPINPLQFGFDIIDDIKPTISKIKIYPIDGEVNGQKIEKSFNLKNSGGKYTLSGTTPTVKGKVAFSISTFDKLNGAYNKNGVYSIKLFVDSNLIYHFQMDEFDFAESRYLNAHIDYKEKKISRTKFHRCYKLPNNRLSVYKEMIKKGVFEFKDDTTHLVQFQVKDIYNNTSNLSFEVNSITTKTENEKAILFAPFSQYFSYMKPNIFKENDFQLHMESYSLYKDFNFEYFEKDSIKGVFGKVHHAHHDFVPIHKKFVISIRGKVPEKLKDKAYIAKVDDNNRFWYMGGFWRNGMLSAKVREFGDFCIVADTINPTIKGVNIYPGKKLNTQKTIKCTIEDKESGIKTYRAEIDGKWILMEYDYKRKLLTYKIQKKLEKGKHIFKLEVIDKLNNTTVYNAEFIR